MGYFRNKRTGLTWHVTNDDHIKRLKADSDYLEVTGINIKDTSQTIHHEPVQTLVEQEASENRTNYSEMNWNDLRTLASEKGINTKGMKRQQIEDKLGEESWNS